MKQGQDISAEFPGVLIIHQKIKGNSVDDHAHDEHEFFLPLQGEIQIQAGQELLKAGPGKMIYLPPSSTHSFRASSSSEGERLIFMIQPRLWKANEGGSFPPSVISASQLSKELLFHLLIHPKTRAARSLLDTLVQTLSEMLEDSGLQNMGDIAHLEGRSQDPRIRKALQAISASFDQSLPMERLARESGMSVRNFNRLFLSELGMTPKQAVTLYRIERAKGLLKGARRSVTDVAFEVGYQSVSQFITTFRKATGQLPSEYLSRT